MADHLWSMSSPLHKALSLGRQGALFDKAGAILTELTGFSLVQVMSRRGRWADTAMAAQARWGVAPPERPAAALGEQATLIWSGPGQFLALFPAQGLADPLQQIRGAFAGVAALSDQSGGRCLLRISGPSIRDGLAKVCSLDFHDKMFPVGAAAATAIDHMNAGLWRGTDAADGSPTYNLLVPTSFAGSLLHTFVDAAAEYSVDLRSETFDA